MAEMTLKLPRNYVTAPTECLNYVVLHKEGTEEITILCILSIIIGFQHSPSNS